MKYDDFMNRVQDQAGIESKDEAIRLTRATLETLGERLYRSQRDDLTAQLPNELNGFLRARVFPETTPRDVDRFTLEEFYNRVNARAGLGYPRAVAGVKVVMAVLRQAIAAGEWEDLRSELPDEYAEILAQT
jgi:uncharacterized protein (DUF2267 family)